MTLANDKRPTTFEEYIGQSGAVNYIKSIIKSNNHPAGIILNGMPGTGKTTLAQLYVKGTLCECREEGSSELCGTCDVCVGGIENNPNVTYYRITEATVFKEAVGDLIAMTKAAPMVTHDNLRADNRRRFIIIDELQNATRQSISPFLDSLEFAAPEVTVILISMDLDKLDHIVRDAIESRCIELSLDRLSTEDISARLQEEYEDLHPEAADLIAYLSRGNMRKAWSLLEYFSAQIPVLELTAKFISSQKLGGFSRNKCMEILDSLENHTWDDTAKLLRAVSANAEQAVDFFVTSIVDEDLNPNGIELISACSFWLQTDYKTPMLSLFRPFQGKKLIGAIIEEAPRSIHIDSVASVKATNRQVQIVKNNIAQQLSNITGQEVKVPTVPCKPLGFTKWSQFLEYYADNN